jgi:hypothetical protein
VRMLPAKRLALKSATEYGAKNRLGQVECEELVSRRNNRFVPTLAQLMRNKCKLLHD